jgi:putative FmdB family regulatory protein
MIYEFKCPECRISLYITRSIHDEVSAPSCPDCKLEGIRVWTAPPITFAGSGFYSTDNKK